MTVAADADRITRYGMVLGVGALYLFGLCSRLVPTGVGLALALLLVATALCYRSFWPALRGAPIFNVFVVFVLYLAVRTAWAVWEFPQTTAEQFTDAGDFLQAWFFLMIGWWYATDPRRIPRILLLALLGFIASMAYHFDWTQLGALLRGERTGFGMGAIPFGLYSGTGILGLLVLAPRFWGNGRPVGLFVARILVWIILMAVLTQGLISSQSRTTWLACLVVIPPLTVLRIRHWLKLQAAIPWKQATAAIAAGIALLLVVLYVNLGTIRHRITGEESTAEAVATLDVSKIPFTKNSSIGVRFHLYEYGFEKWLKRPVFGWGPGTTKYLIDQNPIKPLRIWMHLHNTYLEVLVRLGVVGALILLAGIWYVVRGLWRAYTSGALAYDMFLLLAGVIALLAIWSSTDFRMIHADWRAYWLLLGGAAYAYPMGRARNGRAADG